MRALYVIASHTRPEQVLRLVETLRRGSPDAHLVVHHDARTTRVDAGALAALGAHLLAPPTPVAWGRASQLAMHVRALAWALRAREFDWLMLLSGQDYPLRPPAAIEADLAAADVDAFLERAPVGPAPRRLHASADEFALRYQRAWRPLPVRRPGSLALARRVAAAARPLVVLREMPTGPPLVGLPARTPWSPALRPYRGADWYTLSRRAVAAVLAFGRARPDVLRFVLRSTVLPTEAYVHTALHNDPSLRIAPETRRWSRWSPGDQHPAVLGMGDLDAALASGADFARKFDPEVDADVLAALDRRVLAGPGRVR
jgi:hypothetical protein